MDRRCADDQPQHPGLAADPAAGMGGRGVGRGRVVRGAGIIARVTVSGPNSGRRWVKVPWRGCGVRID